MEADTFGRVVLIKIAMPEHDLYPYQRPDSVITALLRSIHDLCLPGSAQDPSCTPCFAAVDWLVQFLPMEDICLCFGHMCSLVFIL